MAYVVLRNAANDMQRHGGACLGYGGRSWTALARVYALAGALLEERAERTEFMRGLEKTGEELS